MTLRQFRTVEAPGLSWMGPATLTSRRLLAMEFDLIGALPISCYAIESNSGGCVEPEKEDVLEIRL